MSTLLELSPLPKIVVTMIQTFIKTSLFLILILCALSLMMYAVDGLWEQTDNPSWLRSAQADIHQPSVSNTSLPKKPSPSVLPSPPPIAQTQQGLLLSFTAKGQLQQESMQNLERFLQTYAAHLQHITLRAGKTNLHPQQRNQIMQLHHVARLIYPYQQNISIVVNQEDVPPGTVSLHWWKESPTVIGP